MKKLLLASLSFAVLTANAQTNQKAKSGGKEAMKIGAELGLNIANYTISSGSETLKTSSRVGAKVGGYFDINLNKNIYLQPGLYYMMNGYSLSEDIGSGGTFKQDVRINTLTIPVNGVYKFGKAGDNRFFAGLGLYLGYNLGGSYEATENDGAGHSDSKSGDVKIGSDKESDLKAMDMGFNLLAGYQLKKGFAFKACYQRGFTNLMPDAAGSASTISSGFSISAAYLFDMGKKSGKK